MMDWWVPDLEDGRGQIMEGLENCDVRNDLEN